MPNSPKKLSNWVGGVASAPIAGLYMENTNPATNKVISMIPRSQAEDVDQAVLLAEKAYAVWSKYSFEERADVIDAIANRIEERIDEFALAESQDTGKPFHIAKNVDISRVISNFRFFAGAVRHDQTGCHMMADALNYTVRKPLGVVGLITPWNLPLYLLSWKVAPALAMGNVVIAKPSELTPTTASLLGDVIREVGAPLGIYSLLHGTGPEVGSAITTHPKIKAISFTGGTKTGKTVAETAGGQFKKISLELGGKNASIVFADCDLEKTVAGVTRAAFLNQGQICLCGSRILVQRDIYAKFIDLFAKSVSQLKVGNPNDATSHMGSLISLEHRKKVQYYVEEGIRAGGRILVGGTIPNMDAPFTEGAWFAPTVIVDAPATCSLSMEEVFGPVVSVHPFDTDQEAIEIANSVEYGLAATVWTSNLERAHQVSRALDTGMVWVNTWLHRDLRVPFGGVKHSGVGREGGAFSLDFYSHAQNICISLPR